MTSQLCNHAVFLNACKTGSRLLIMIKVLLHTSKIGSGFWLRILGAWFVNNAGQCFEVLLEAAVVVQRVGYHMTYHSEFKFQTNCPLQGSHIHTCTHDYTHSVMSSCRHLTTWNLCPFLRISPDKCTTPYTSCSEYYTSLCVKTMSGY